MTGSGRKDAAVVAVVADLIFASKVAATGRAAGVPVRVVRSADDAGGAALILVDFDHPDLDVPAAIARWSAADPRPRIVAFGSHVETARMQAARAAGADEVLPRSAFVRRLPEILGAAV